MPVPPSPSYLDSTKPPAGSGGFELYRGTTFLYALPLTMKPGTVGGELDLTLDRAPFSPVMFPTGDGLPAPEFITLTGRADWNDYRTAVSEKSLIRQACRVADRLVFNGLTFSQLQVGTGDARYTDLDSPMHSDISIRLAPTVLLTPEGIAELASYLLGLLAVKSAGNGQVTVTPVPGAVATPGTYTLHGANGASFQFLTQTVDYQGAS